MTPIPLSRHAQTRMRQRGFRDDDLAVLLDTATPVGGDVYLLTDADVSRAVARRKHEIQRLERLRGAKLVVGGDQVVTVYRADPANQRRTLRQAREAQ